MTRPLTYDHLIGKKKPLTKTIPVVFDPELADEYNEAFTAREVAQIRAANRRDDPEAGMAFLEAEQRLAEVLGRLEEAEAVHWFKFRGIGRHRFAALVEAHPPTAEQRIKAKAAGIKDELQWNPDTFSPALVAACLVEPQVTEEQAILWWNDANWNHAELDTLLAAAIEVNGTRRTVELGKGSPRIRSSEPKSPSA